MKSLADELSKVSKKMSEYQAENKLAEQVPRFSEKEVGSSSSRQGQHCNRSGRCTEKIESSKRDRVGEKSLQRYDEWAALSKKAFHPSLKGFVSSQLREDLESNDDIQVIGNPDSTTSGAGKKKHRK